jgi:hypothetical protein
MTRYVEAIGRNPGEELLCSHLYAEVSEPTDVASHALLGARTGYLPMCVYGWNRSDGAGFSIFRGHTGARGLCKICEKRAKAGLSPIETANRKTKWM